MKITTKDRYCPICRKEVEVVERVEPSVKEDSWISIVSCPFCGYLFNRWTFYKKGVEIDELL